MNTTLSILRSARLNDLLGFLVCVLPLLYLVGSGVADAVLVFCGLLLIVQQCVLRSSRLLRARWVQVALVLIGYLLIQSFFVENLQDALARSAGFVRFPLAALVVAIVLSGEAVLRGRFAISLMAVVIFLALDALLQYFTGTDIFGKPSIGGAYPRLTGPYDSPKIGIILAWLSMPVIMLIALGKPFEVHPVFRVALIAAIVAAVVLSGERMALLLLLLGLVLGILLYTKRFLLGCVAAGIISILLAATIYFAPADGELKRRVDSFTNYLSNIWETPYGQIWISAGKIFADNPVLGVGLKHFRDACLNEKYNTLHPLDVRCNLHPHQLYLEWLAETGIIGTILFLLMIFFVMRDMLSVYPRIGKNPFYIGLVVAVCLRLWPISTSTSFFVAWSALPFWMLLGAALSYAYEGKADDTPSLAVKDARS